MKENQDVLLAGKSPTWWCFLVHVHEVAYFKNTVHWPEPCPYFQTEFKLFRKEWKVLEMN